MKMGKAGHRSALVRRGLVRVPVALIAAGLAACATGPGQAPNPVLRGPLNLSIEVAADVNPDGRNRPSPIVIRIYELDGNGAFQGADFVGLFEREQATLGTSLQGREEVQLVPGQRAQVQRSLKPATRFIAVAAAFRDLERASWRAAIDLRAQAVSHIRITLSGRRLRLDPLN